MSRMVYLGAAVLALSAVGTAALGQGVITDVKTPQLRSSDTYHLPIDIHIEGDPTGAGLPNWAGALMKVHILDSSEVDIDSIVPVHPTTGSTGGTNPFGPRSENQQSVAKFFTVWHPLALQSGITLQPSVNEPVFDMDVHAKGTTLGQNSDVDVTFMFWNIRHLGTVPPSHNFTVRKSDYVYAHPQTNPLLQSELPLEPPRPGNGRWVHATDTKIFHVTATPGGAPPLGSFFYATFLNTATLGIEHVPEPASAILLGCGALSGLVSLVMRRRRRLAA